MARKKNHVERFCELDTRTQNKIVKIATAFSIKFHEILDWSQERLEIVGFTERQIGKIQEQETA